MPGRTLFVSDVHLRPDDTPGAEERAARFFEFAREAASRPGTKRVETMYVLGDLFDYWYEPGRRAPAAFARRNHSAIVSCGNRITKTRSADRAQSA